MDIKELDKDLVGIIKVINKLAQIGYNDAEYDKVEEDLHEKEDDFMDKHGDYLDQALKNVHERDCPDTEILLPIAYLAKKYRTDFDIIRDYEQFKLLYEAVNSSSSGLKTFKIPKVGWLKLFFSEFFRRSDLNGACRIL